MFNNLRHYLRHPFLDSMAPVDCPQSWPPPCSWMGVAVQSGFPVSHNSTGKASLLSTEYGGNAVISTMTVTGAGALLGYHEGPKTRRHLR